MNNYNKISSNIRVAALNGLAAGIPQRHVEANLSEDSQTNEIVNNIATTSQLLAEALDEDALLSPLDAANKKRLQANEGLYELLKGYMKLTASSQNSLVGNVFSIVSKYRSLLAKTKGYNAITGHINSMIIELEEPTILSRLDAALYAKGEYLALKQANQDFIDAQADYNSESAERKKRANASKLKKQLLNMINNQLVCFLNAQENLGNTSYTAFADSVAETINKENLSIKINREKRRLKREEAAAAAKAAE
ncbi:MAG: hypothetical protein ACK5LR_10930 [Mangrovibacterium sp.]